MSRFTTLSKIELFVGKNILGQHSKWTMMLESGNLYEFELDLFEALNQTYDMISEELMKMASTKITGRLMMAAKANGGRKIEVRQTSVRLATGHQIKIVSPYVKKPPRNWIGSRHLLENHWRIIGGSSPFLYDKVGFCSALGPSYDLAHQTLRKFGVNLSISSVRDITNRFANKCFNLGEENLLIEKNESLAGKRVIVSIDGGRTRIRSYQESEERDGNANQLKYETPWCEPKLFVIDVLNNEGQIDNFQLPIYGCRFSDVDLFALLERYLKKLEIEKAEQVQIVADGAPWIWNNTKSLLTRLNVEASRIIETLDYYHVTQYIHLLIDEMPSRIGKKQRALYLKQFKMWLWAGMTDQIIQICRTIFKRPNQLVKRWINYLEKHIRKTQYTDYERRHLMCGSGIIESGIRRIINLRFKNASTFWKKEIVEKLYLLRAALLSKRWNLLIQNLST